LVVGLALVAAAVLMLLTTDGVGYTAGAIALGLAAIAVSRRQ